MATHEQILRNDEINNMQINGLIKQPKVFNNIFRAFKYRNYSLYFTGQGISLIGFWMQQIALSWLVYHMTNSEFLLGLVGFSNLIPFLFFTPLGGILADRINRRRILITIQTLSMIQAGILTYLTFTGIINIGYIIGLSIFMGIINSIEAPTRQSFVTDIVEKKEDLGNAIALNSTMFNTSRLIGPPVAGLIIAAAGEKICFLINTITYLAVLISLFSMKIIPKNKNNQKTKGLKAFQEGFNYAFSFKPVKYILFLVGFVGLMGTPYIVLLPVFAKNILHGGPNTFGLLMGAAAFGSIIGNIYIASKTKVIGLWKIIPYATAILGLGIILFSQSTVLWISLLLLLLTGFGMILQMIVCNTVIQTIVDDDKRGRVMSFYSMAFMGIMPLGSLLAGFMASHIGAQSTLLMAGISCFLAAFIFKNRLSVFDSIVINETEN